MPPVFSILLLFGGIGLISELFAILVHIARPAQHRQRQGGSPRQAA